jgi:hypothetical protein
MMNTCADDASVIEDEECHDDIVALLAMNECNNL